MSDDASWVELTSARIFAVVALGCLALLAVGVIWSSDRAFEITDEAYYVLSAMHPHDVELYVSAQHWVLAPIWSLTGSLQGFRIAGAIALVLSAAILAVGAIAVFRYADGDVSSRLAQVGCVAAAAIGALLYVATIAPSPSYNLLASAGAYSGAGFALLSSRCLGWKRVVLCLLSGAALAISFVSKPSAGVCAASFAAFFVLTLSTGYWRWLSVPLIGLGMLAVIALLYVAQQADPPVLDSLRNGLDLFRLVQTEPVGTRLARYAGALVKSYSQSVAAFAPGLACAVLLRMYPRIWLAALLPLVLVVSMAVGAHHLGGMFSYHRQMEAIVALMIATLILTPVRLAVARQNLILVIGLLGLPYAVAIGTGNALFTQTIVSLAPWTLIAAILAVANSDDWPMRLARRSTAALLLVLVTTQILTSYGREPYHLAVPLTGQNQRANIGGLGRVKVDDDTIQSLKAIDAARQTCGIEAGAAFLGLYNVPGLALALEAIPPVSPWLNGLSQFEMILTHWEPDPGTRILLALTTEAQGDAPKLPPALLPLSDKFLPCGKVPIAFSGEMVEIWASRK